MAWGKIEAIQCILDLGAQIDAIDKDGKSGVLLATKLDSVDILKVSVLLCVCKYVYVCMYVPMLLNIFLLASMRQ